MKSQKKTLIGVLASHDAKEKNVELCRVLEYICGKRSELLDSFHFVFTGGTYHRLVLGESAPSGETEVVKVSDKTKKALAEHITILPPFKEGGIILMSYLITQRRLSLLWSFLTQIGRAHV